MNNVKEFLSRFNNEYFFSVPSESNVVYGFIVFYVLILLVAILGSFWLRRKDKVLKTFSKTFFWTNLTIGLAGTFLVFSRVEGVSIFSWRFWQYLLIFFFILINSYFAFIKKTQLKEEIEKNLRKSRKEKWLKKGKKKKKS